MLHEALHVVLMVGFLVGIAGSFLSFVLPMIAGSERRSLVLPVGLGVGALVVFGIDWIVHRG